MSALMLVTSTLALDSAEAPPVAMSCTQAWQSLRTLEPRCHETCCLPKFPQSRACEDRTAMNGLHAEGFHAASAAVMHSRCFWPSLTGAHACWPPVRHLSLLLITPAVAATARLAEDSQIRHCPVQLTPMMQVTPVNIRGLYQNLQSSCKL